jgi:hypothetical protein
MWEFPWGSPSSVGLNLMSDLFYTFNSRFKSTQNFNIKQIF